MNMFDCHANPKLLSNMCLCQTDSHECVVAWHACIRQHLIGMHLDTCVCNSCALVKSNVFPGLILEKCEKSRPGWDNKVCHALYISQLRDIMRRVDLDSCMPGSRLPFLQIRIYLLATIWCIRDSICFA